MNTLAWTAAGISTYVIGYYGTAYSWAREEWREEQAKGRQLKKEAINVIAAAALVWPFMWLCWFICHVPDHFMRVATPRHLRRPKQDLRKIKGRPERDSSR